MKYRVKREPRELEEIRKKVSDLQKEAFWIHLDTVVGTLIAIVFIGCLLLLATA